MMLVVARNYYWNFPAAWS